MLLTMMSGRVVPVGMVVVITVDEALGSLLNVVAQWEKNIFGNIDAWFTVEVIRGVTIPSNIVIALKLAQGAKAWVYRPRNHLIFSRGNSDRPHPWD